MSDTPTPRTDNLKAKAVPAKRFSQEMLVVGLGYIIESVPQLERELAEARSMTEGQWLLKVAARLVTAGCKSDGIVDAMDELIQQRDTLAEALEQFVNVCDHAPPVDIIKHIGESCASARKALVAVKGGSHE